MDGEASNPRDRELVANLGWVQHLALSLARDRDAADDLAQDVARVWLEKRPALADGPRGWLASVARKLALDRARSDVSRKARERSVSRPEGEGFEVVERGARQRRVAEAVMQLAEPYRSTILYRYLDGLSTREVAERMGTNEAAVRKRVERGLALLRERLEREFGSRANAWAAALLEPGLRSALLKGVGIMSMKWIAAAGAVALLAGGVWYLRAGMTPEQDLEVGGKGVVVPLEVAEARERPATDPASTLENAAEAPRTSVAPEAAPVQSGPRLRGFVFVDDRHTAPADLTITRKADETRVAEAARVDTQAASWSLDTLGGKPGRLWIASSTTVPAQIPVPAELWEQGGVFDLHLSAGRTLELTILDQDTKQPLPDLEFQVSKSIEISRTRGSVGFDGNRTNYRTDARGKAQVLGLPLAGSVSVTVDFGVREREVVMRDGVLSRMGMQRDPDWQTWLKPEQPAHLEQTILVRPPLGEACAGGQVPPWAIAQAGGADALRVVARETTRESPQARGIPFLLAHDEQGRFELCASAPSTQAVWLERKSDRQRMSEETQLEFARPGRQEPIVFRQLQLATVALHFVHVPAQGELEALVFAAQSSRTPPQSVRMSCAGEPFTRELSLAPGDRLQLSLRLQAGPGEKAGWMRRLDVDPERDRELTIDLAGSARSLSIECAELPPRGEGELVLVGCTGNEVSDQYVLAFCADGRANARVHVPDGRWLFKYTGSGTEDVLWGVVETRGAGPQELVLRPRVRFVAAEELGAGIRFDEIEGVSLASMPEKLRVFSAKAPGTRIALPFDAKYVTLAGK